MIRSGSMMIPVLISELENFNDKVVGNVESRVLDASQTLDATDQAPETA
jgi:hypothetical protein